jgi:hypothetical protein
MMVSATHLIVNKAGGYVVLVHKSIEDAWILMKGKKRFIQLVNVDVLILLEIRQVT